MKINIIEAGSRRNRALLWKRAAQNISILALAGISVTAGRAQVGDKTPIADKSDLFVQKMLAANPKQGQAAVIARLAGELQPAQEDQIKTLGGTITRRLDIIHSLAIRLPAANLGRLAALPFVAHLSADLSVKKNDQFTADHSGATAAAAQYSLTGKGVSVAVVDSGIRIHPDLCDTTQAGLPSRVLASVNFAADSSLPDDLCGHGTHVAGIIGGNGFSSSNVLLSWLGLPSSWQLFSQTFMGVAPGVSLVNVRVLDKTGQGNVSNMIAGIQWVMQNAKQYNIRVINLSVGHNVGESYKTDPLCQAVESAWKAGITVVCAAGNEGRLNDNLPTPPCPDNEGYGTDYGSIQSPGNDPYVITVGAVKNADGNRAHDVIATYSSRGPSRLDMVMKPDLVAPGNRVISLESYGSYLQTTYAATNHVPWSAYTSFNIPGSSFSYFQLSGTSMATPVVSGAAALLLSQNPNLTPDTVKARLMVSADKWADAKGNYDPLTYGAGYVNIVAALQSTATAATAAISPTLFQDAKTGKVEINNVIWGKNVIWGLNTPSTANALNVIWGKNVIWGSNVVIGSSNVIWGKNVWTDNVIWGVSTGQADLSTTVIAGEK